MQEPFYTFCWVVYQGRCANKSFKTLEDAITFATDNELRGTILKSVRGAWGVYEMEVEKEIK